jgi:PAS domain S-box-containing protein
MENIPSYETLLESKKRYERLVNTVPCALYDYVRWPDGSNQFVYISRHCEQIFGVPKEAIMADSGTIWSLVHPEDVGRLAEADRIANERGQKFQGEVRIYHVDGTLKWIQIISMPSKQKHEGRTIWSGIMLDVSERKFAELERNQLYEELKQVVSELKVLKGIIPICSYCKKIRDDKGFWNQVESYISKHSEADLSHSICPECAKRLYPDMDIYDK